MELRLYNSRTRVREVFTPVDPENVRMYVCGPTVYDRAHIGNARSVVVFDTLCRLLRHLAPANGWGRVTYARNITDVDDKINARAMETGRPIRDITDETIRWFAEDMSALGDAGPDLAPRATEYIPEMQEMIRELVAAGNAYEADGHVLFGVASYPHYGSLARRSTEDMLAGARVEVAPYKRNPMDFVLWKPSDENLPGWESPWGRGRPGWHIECSAMTRALFGETFDIHGGGSDLLFPHHENERAQSCCLTSEASFARVWMHNEMLQVEGRKMAKSLGNHFTVRDLLDAGMPGEVVRFVLLGTHYSKPLDWTRERARAAQSTLRQWRRLAKGSSDGGDPAPAVVKALANDLNTPGAIAELHELARRDRGAELMASARLIGLMTDELGDWVGDCRIDAAHASRVEAILGKRAAARSARDFAEADRLRDLLLGAGVTLRDSSDGTSWDCGPDFDPGVLEADDEP